MSLERRTTNPGKRERVARKRHKRGLCGSGGEAFKLGRKHFRRWIFKHLAVADSRND